MSEGKKTCIDCKHWRQQSGSSHVLCPKRVDFSFSHGLPTCELFEEGEPETREVNQFIHWAGIRQAD
jgi:hypothetical protein